MQRSWWQDPLFWAAAGAAPVFWLGLAVAGWPVVALTWPAHEPQRFLLLVAVYPVLEEIAFRGGLQPALASLTDRWPWAGLGLVTLPNVLTSLGFAALHLLGHAPLWAAAVFVPSLVFGVLRDRHHSVASPIALHVFYNTGYFWLFGR